MTGSTKRSSKVASKRHGRTAEFEAEASAAEAEGKTVVRAGRADVEAGEAERPLPESDRLALAACDVLGDLKIVTAALTSGNDDRIRRALAGPIGIAARSTVERLRSIEWQATYVIDDVALAAPPLEATSESDTTEGDPA